MLPLLFARRYLRSPKSHSVINLIAGVSVVAFAMPVAAMVILLSVFNGFSTLARAMSSSFDAPLTLRPAEGQHAPIATLDTTTLRRTPGVEAFSLVLEQQVLLERNGRQEMVRLRGVDQSYTEVLPIRQQLVAGEMVARDEVVLGRAMAQALGIRTLSGAELTLYALRPGASFSTLLPTDGYTRRRAAVAGIFALDLKSEQGYALTSLRTAQELLNRPASLSAAAIRLQPDADPAKVAAQIQHLVGPAWEVVTPEELNASFFRLVRYEKWGVFFISLLVLIIASFSVVGTLSMLIIEKRTERQTLRALGADTRLIRRIFVGEGVLLGSLGALIGEVLGVGLCLAQQHWGLIRIPAETLLIDRYPVELQVGDLLLITATFATVVTTVSVATVHSMIKKEN